MVACELEQKDANAFPGVTLFTKRQAPGMKPTAVYLPPKHPTAATKFDVVIWLHGFYVKNHEFLFHNDPARLREQVRDSGKDVVLIAPFLGYEYAVGDTFAGNYNVSDLATASWGERYLEEVLGALARFLGLSSTSIPQLQIGKLIIACHSGGGNGMRNLVGNLGKYQGKLTACWGFDCLYGANARPDDATFWYQWLSGQSGRALEIVYGPSTLPQSVKLDLIGRGLATADGNQAQPQRPALKNLSVRVGHYDLFPAFGQMVRVNDLDPAYVDRFMIPQVADQPPLHHKPAPQHGEFLQGAISNVRSAFPFPKDIHYMIARGGFFSRLSKL
ncbi:MULTISPECIES: hypothetical protein [Bradyrhizobium]|uniref:Bll3610 protein n=1 Tax=Bradyrhizobium diazoefficiens (strain JCM 10833 / BCRC 13528 / IAM 13628 / NBRC 14792 / USDA 110) TaxID=224911 RepID=Q89P73_BRADU|nr:hypothetical protein [Bradyrhizobium diazoefficiens]AND88970.1 hypothetical protein AAV28_15060 [Bradyrhizobium diazoefficiens USDA 110]AWO90561.1 hypothetical protein DI395_20110 [Bradyrhizobium diazoefficiens]PDT60166.1 hypothetical protein CO678_17840 [Bradyrhizobium diazoefficiens]QBP22386.1 hypothetical protein Bdiaspc4_18635 [Bradyrhizobium diazoefficiens]QLD44641.1 hypothetical protein HUW42_28280 [Bradyrhizobium diazoefficiens]